MPRTDERLITSLLALKRVLRERVERAGDGAASYVRIAALSFIEADRPDMKDLASHLAVTPPTATLIVRALTRKGFVRTAKDGRDRRHHLDVLFLSTVSLVILR